MGNQLIGILYHLERFQTCMLQSQRVALMVVHFHTNGLCLSQVGRLWQSSFKFNAVGLSLRKPIIIVLPVIFFQPGLNLACTSHFLRICACSNDRCKMLLQRLKFYKKTFGNCNWHPSVSKMTCKNCLLPTKLFRESVQMLFSKTLLLQDGVKNTSSSAQANNGSLQLLSSSVQTMQGNFKNLSTKLRANEVNIKVWSLKTKTLQEDIRTLQPLPPLTKSLQGSLQILTSQTRNLEHDVRNLSSTSYSNKDEIQKWSFSS